MVTITINKLNDPYIFNQLIKLYTPAISSPEDTQFIINDKGVLAMKICNGSNPKITILDKDLEVKYESTNKYKLVLIKNNKILISHSNAIL